MKIKIVTHYAESDLDFSYDYLDIEIYVDDVCVQQYGDHYHDKGSEKVDGWLDGFKFAMKWKNLNVQHINVADRKEY